MSKYKLFAVIPARDARYVKEKIEEMESSGLPFVIVCGERIDHKNVVYRPPKGKYDAINYAIRFIPREAEIVIFNDVDTKIPDHNMIFKAINLFNEDPAIGLIFGKDLVKEGPQVLFHRWLYAIIKRVPIIVNGDIIFIRRVILQKLIPLPPCKAEDALLGFKVLELGYKVVFNEKCFVFTNKTGKEVEEIKYKRRTVGGIYQALSYCHSKGSSLLIVKMFYILLPLLLPFLLLTGKKGYCWFKGISLGICDFLKKDNTGIWI
jgi:cellulose synthase/poly-beta-1,6-N-acetylglucosamine synthase-like glycosyltransferase